MHRSILVVRLIPSLALVLAVALSPPPARAAPTPLPSALSVRAESLAIPAEHADLSLRPGSTRYTVWTMGRDFEMYRDYFAGRIEVVDPAASGDLTEVRHVGWDAAGRLRVEPSSGRVSDTGYWRHDGKSFSKYLRNRHGRLIGSVSLVDGESVSIVADLDLDATVDLWLSIDLGSEQAQFVFRDSADVLGEVQELLAGRDALCRGGAEADDSASAGSFSQDADPAALLSSCGLFASSGSPGVGPFGFDGGGGNTMDEMCESLLARVGTSPPGQGLVSQPPASRTDGAPGERDSAASVASGLKKAGRALMEWGGAAAGTGTPQGAALSVPLRLLGAALQLAAEAVESLDPMPGETPSPSETLARFCEDRVKGRGSHDLGEIGKRLGERECSDPVAGGGAAIALHGPVQPELEDPLAGRHCRNPEIFHDPEGFMKRLDPDASCTAGPDGNVDYRCDHTVPSVRRTVDYSWGDIFLVDFPVEMEAGAAIEIVNPGR